MASALAIRAKASVGYPAAWLEEWRSPLTIRAEYLAATPSLVALSGDTLVGICVLEARGAEGSLEHLWVDPEFQRHGIGGALMQRALALAAEAGLRRVEVDSDPSALAFYQRLGARPCGTRPAPMPGAPERELPVLEFVLDERA